MPAMQPVTNFVDGVVVHQGDMNNLSTNISTLCQQTTGKTPTAGASSKPLAQVDLSVVQSIPNNTVTLVSWNLASAQPTDIMWVASVPTQLSVITAGWYAMDLQVCWDNGLASNRGLGIMINGTTPSSNSISEINYLSTVTTVFKHRATAYAHLSVGATIYAYVAQISGGGSLNINPSSISYPGTFMSVRWDAP